MTGRPQLSAEAIVDSLVDQARGAMREVADWDQERIDEAVVAVAWSLYKPEHAAELAELAVSDTGLGNVPDKVIKNQRKTFGTLRDLLRTRTVGPLDDEPVRGITRYGKPAGVVAAITPSTNPAATPVNNAMMAVKGANAIILAPSPAGWLTTAKAAEYARAALARIGAPEDLVQVLPSPVTRELTTTLMEAADLVVATGSQRNVRGAYRSGTPALGVGAGNVPVIVDETADLAAAALRIRQSKTFDNATSCSSENAIVIVDEVYDAMMQALRDEGAHVASAEEARSIEDGLFEDGHLRRNVLAQDYPVLRELLNIGGSDDDRFVVVEEPAPAADRPLTGEKLSLVLTAYRARDFDHAVELVRGVLEFQGIGHSVGIHTADSARPQRLGSELPVVRVLVNQAHTFGNGGSFDNAMPFTLSMGCGTWAGNSITENLNVMNFINITHVVTTIEPDEPTEEALFGSHWSVHGRD